MSAVHIEWSPRIASGKARATSGRLVRDIELLLGLVGNGRSCAEAVGDLADRRDGVLPDLVWSEKCRLAPVGDCELFDRPSSCA